MGLPLITLAEVKAYTGITSSNQDVEINSLIPKVSAIIKTYCRRTFIDYVNEEKVEIDNGLNSPYIYTEEPRVLAISSLEVSYDYGQTYTALQEYVDYVLDYTYDRVQSTTGIFTNRINGYKITYTAGYDEVPQDLKQAALDLVVYYMRNDMAIKSSKVAGTNTVQIEYVTTNAMPAHISRVLNQFIRDYA